MQETLDARNLGCVRNHYKRMKSAFTNSQLSRRGKIGTKVTIHSEM